MRVRVFCLSVAIVAAFVLSAGAADAPEPKLAPVEPTARLITPVQYVNTLRSIFGRGLTYPSKFAPIPRVGGLISVGAGNAIVTDGALEQFDASGRAIAAQVVAPRNRSFLIPCRPEAEETADDTCAAKFFDKVGRLLFRRRLRQNELGDYVIQAHAAAEKARGFYPGLSIALAAMLQEPQFLYVTQPIVQVKGQAQLTPYAKASRLSLLLWNSYPDDELLAAAESGKLNQKKELQKQVDRLLADPDRLSDGVRNFFDDMLIFEAFETLAKDGTIYPAFTAKVAEDAKEQTLRTIAAHVVNDNADYRDLFTTKKTFLTNDLGAIYGVAIEQADRWVPYEFPDGSPRAGLLSQISFLSLYSHPGRSSPTRRGKAIREVFLCQKVPDPPANVDFSALDNPDPRLKTARERLAEHSTNPVCAGCHKITDPIGLAFENFDGAGMYRASESGTTIDASGNLDSAAFTDMTGLATAMRNSPKMISCLTQRLSSYALGRELKNPDSAWVAYIQDRFAASGYRLKDLLRTIALSDEFFAVPKLEAESPTGEKNHAAVQGS